MQNKKDAIVLATFNFCNRLGNYELVDPFDWPEICVSTALAFYSSYEKNNSIERPDFYEKYIFEYENDWVTPYNSHYTKCTSSNYNDPMLRDLTPDLMFSSRNGPYRKKGDPIKRKVFPKSVYKVFEKHKDEIYLDTLLWGSPYNRYVKIRKEFFNDDNHESTV